MAVRFHPHALERIQERGATEDEAAETVQYGERFPAKFGRTGFRRNFPFGAEWHGREYGTKQVEVYAVQEGSEWLVITVLTRYF
ncbi:MAG: hypothetical protein ABSG91_11010 [Syntrophobacteraceae bacterium]|jgi:hypothetical protein